MGAMSIFAAFPMSLMIRHSSAAGGKEHLTSSWPHLAPKRALAQCLTFCAAPPARRSKLWHFDVGARGICFYRLRHAANYAQ